MDQEIPCMTPCEEPNTMLIVDDTILNRMVLSRIFQKSYHIETAENGQDGLKYLLDHRHEICAVLLDVVMPVMGGMELLRLLKGSQILKQIPIFLITAETSGAVVEEAYTLGVMDVINKPVVPHVVERRVNSVIELFQARRRLGNKVEEQQSQLLCQTQRIAELSFGMVEALSTAIEFRSGESGGHVRRIRSITEMMLRQTELGEGLNEDEVTQISLAAVMHDVGKIAIPDAILNKPGKLTKEEFDIMKTHTVQGSILLSRIPQMREHSAYRYAYDIALHHHERWDGSGYPDGLEGDEISIWAQIVSIADVYDALVSKRVYKEAYDYDKAVDMICRGECGHFNPRLLDSFLSIEDNLRCMYRCQSKKKMRR